MAAAREVKDVEAGASRADTLALLAMIVLAIRALRKSSVEGSIVLDTDLL